MQAPSCIYLISTCEKSLKSQNKKKKIVKIKFNIWINHKPTEKININKILKVKKFV